MADSGIAKQKWSDLMHEAQPRAVAARPAFIEGATKHFHSGERPLEAMRNEVSAGGNKYICLGTPLPDSASVDSNGISRVVDLPTVFSRGYVKQAFYNTHDVENEEQFIQAVAQGRFVPERDMDEELDLRGRTMQTWWFAANAATAVDLDKLRKQLTIEEYPSYAKGVIRLDLPPAEMKTAHIEVYKPTVFDRHDAGYRRRRDVGSLEARALGPDEAWHPRGRHEAHEAAPLQAPHCHPAKRTEGGAEGWPARGFCCGAGSDIQRTKGSAEAWLTISISSSSIT